MSRSVLTLLLLALLTFFAGLGQQAITDSDEAYYAEASREMLESGDWLTPRFNYENRFQKPVLYYWLTALTYRVAGVSEWAARLWSALSGLGLVLITWVAARRVSGRVDTAWLAGALVATCFGCFSEARLSLPDLPLTFFITAAIWSALRAADPPGAAGDDARLTWWAAAGLAAGLGFLMKGPVALVVPAIILLPVWWRERRSVVIRPAGIAVAAIVFAVVGLPWYLAMWQTHGTAYLESFFVGDNLERFATERFNQRRLPGLYLLILVGGFMPWSAFLVALPARSVGRVLSRRRMLTDTEWRLVLWAAMPLLFYTASVGQQPRYILPVLPPGAILLACAFTQRIDQVRAGPISPALRTAAWFTAGILLAIALLLLRTGSALGHAPASAVWGGFVATLLGGAATALATFSGAWHRLMYVVAIAAAAALLSLQFGILTGARPEPVERMAELVLHHRTSDQPVGTYEVFDRNLVFYTHVPHARLEAATADAFVQQSTPVLLVIREEAVLPLKERSGVALRELGRIRYLNVANLRLRTFLRTNPADEVETVLLVTNR